MMAAILILTFMAGMFTVMGWGIPAHNRLSRFFAAEFAIAAAIVGATNGSIVAAVIMGIVATINIIANY